MGATFSQSVKLQVTIGSVMNTLSGLGGRFNECICFAVRTAHGEQKPLADYRGKVLLIVNTATQYILILAGVYFSAN